MIFTTYWFLLFAIAAMTVFRLLPGPVLRQGWLAVACAVFHWHFAGPAGVKPIIVLMILTFLAGLTRRGWVCVLAMIASVAALCFYKYSLFLIGSAVAPFSAALAAALARLAKSVMPGAPPLGVSFFVFEFVHYLFEVRRGGEPIRNPVKFLLFAIFFPSLVAGPIKRYAQFLPSLGEAARSPFSSADLAEGLARAGLGFAKKVLIADQLTAYIDYFQPHFDEQGFLGLQRHRDRLRPDTRHPPSGELQLALCGARPAGFLDPLAHLAQPLDPRLRLHPARRRPSGLAPEEPERPRCVRALRPLARPGPPFRPMGRLPRLRARPLRDVCADSAARPGGRAGDPPRPGYRLGGDPALRLARLAALLLSDGGGLAHGPTTLWPVNPPTPHFPPPARYGWIRPRWFLIGLAVGLGSLAWSGWKISRTD